MSLIPFQDSGYVTMYSHDGLQVEYVIVDKRLKTVNQISYKENFYLYLKIKNLTNRDISIGRWDFPISNPDFFDLYRVEEDGDTIYKRPFLLGSNSKDLSSQYVPAKSQIEYKSAWYNRQSFPMPTYNGKTSRYGSRQYKGRYSLSDTLPVGTYYSKLVIIYGGKSIKLMVKLDINLKK